MSTQPKDKTVYRRVRFSGICAFAKAYGYNYTSVYKHLTGQRPSKTMAVRWQAWQTGRRA